MMEVINEGVMRREDRNIRLRPKGKSNYEDLNFRLAEVSENPENIKLMRNNPSSNHSSSLNQASPPSFCTFLITQNHQKRKHRLLLNDLINLSCLF